MVSIEYEMKLEQFENEIKDVKTMNKKLKILFSNEYDEILGDILNLKEDIFIDQVKEGVSLLLEDYYTDSCLSDDRLSKLLEENITEIKNKYKHDYNLISKAWSTYDKSSKRRSNNDSLLTGFRKHCINTDDHASHNCCSNEKDGERNCHFIIVNDSDSKKGIKFVVCENCKKVYYSSFILARCYKCKVDYYTSLLSSHENPELLLATWENYHCQTFINEKMKCIKCHEHFYINMKTGLLMCLNKKCGFVSKPKRILWQCSICKEDFISGAIPYNPLDAEVTRRLISQTILLKHKAHPKKMPCCKLNVFFTDFYHKHNCDGILYESELDDNIIIVCEKCRSINFYDRFHWTCPKCGKKFIDNSNNNENLENNQNSPNSVKIKSYKKERKEKEKEIDDENKSKKSDRKSDKKEKEKDIVENKKISTPKPTQYISKRLGMKKEKELKEFNLNDNDNENIIEEENYSGIKNEQDNEKKKNENKKIDSARKYRRFHFNSIHINEDDKDKNEEKNKNEEKEKEKEKEKNNNIIEEENDDNNYRTTRSRTTYNKIEKNKDEGRRVFRRFRFEKDNEDKDKVIAEEKEKEKEKVEKEPENVSPRVQWRKRYKKELNQNKSEEKEERERKEKEEREKKEKEKREKEEKERKEKEEKERKEKEEREKEKEKERKEKEEKERREKEGNKNKEENISGRGWFRRLAATGLIDKDKEKESTNKSSKKEKESTNKSSKKEKEETIENDEESDEDNSIDNNEEDNNEIMKFGEDDSDDDEKEKEENPIEPDPLYMNYNFKRNKNKKKTRGMEIKGDEEEDESNEEENNKIKIKKKKSVPQIKIAMSKIPGISEHLFNHINKRMTSILNRCKIPVFNIEDYIFNKKLGEGSYAVIFSVHKNDDKEKKQLALKKIIAKTLTEIDKLSKEFELVHSCIHPNIMKIYGICIRMLDQTTYALYVLMELSYGDWDKEIKMHLMKKKYYQESELINILRQLTSALLFMQQNLKISHRDIKPQNVLLFGDGLYKIADFGEAKEAKLSKQMNTLRGTELYMSPALYSGLKNDRNDVNHDPYKSDVFSLGFCFLYAATLNFNILYQVREIYNGNMMNNIIHKQLDNKYSPIFINILQHMMEVDECERFDFPHLVKYIDENYDKDGNLKNVEKTDEKKSETSHRSINRKKK